MNKVLWLEQPEIRRLLNLLVDKLDQAQLKGKTIIRAVKLDSRSFPALFNAEFEEEKERYWSHLLHMQSWGWFRIRTDRRQSGKAGYELNPRLEIVDAAAIRQAIGRLELIKSASQLWREAVFSGLNTDDVVKTCVADQKLEVSGKTAEEIVERLSRLPELIDEPLLLREVSARLFWGHSKVLDRRQALVATLLNLDECPFPEAPIQLQAFLPKGDFSGVLFIENLTTFERATRDNSGRFAGLALVFASGFKGAAKRLRLETGASVYFAAHGSLDAVSIQRFLNWMFGASEELPSWFWGDLDYSGMQIIKSLRNSFNPLDAWRPGYQPMLDALLKGDGHPPDVAGKSNQKPVVTTGSEYADQKLLPAIVATGKFLDQEF